MRFSQTTPTLLAEKISTALASKVTYPNIPTDGAQKAVQFNYYLFQNNHV